MDVPEQINIPVDWPAARSPLSRTLADHARAINQSLDYDEGDPRYYGAIGDGVTDDTAGVQAAFTHGGRVIISKPYRVTQTINLVLDGTSVFGYSGKLIHETSDLTDVLFASGLSNIDIVGLEIDGRKSLKSGSGAALARGIALYGCTRADVSNCFIHDCYEIGIRVGQDTADPMPSNTITVSNNVCQDNGNAANKRGFGIFGFGEITHLVISGNVCVDNEDGGIFADDVSSSAEPGHENLNVVISSNIVYSTIASYGDSRGIQFSGTTRFTCTGNLVFGYKYGIIVTCGQAGTITGFGTISANDSHGQEYGVFLQSVKQLIISDNRIEADDTNGIVGVDISSPVYGVEPCSDVTVQGNLIYSPNDGVAHGQNSDHAVTSDNIAVRDNTIRLTEAATSGDFGIRMVDVTNAKVVGNEVSDFYIGITITSTATDAIVKDNFVHDCAHYGIELGAPVVVVRNTTRDNTDAGLRVQTAANDAATIIKDNEFIDATPTSGTMSSASLQNNYYGAALEVATGTFTCNSNIPVTEVDSSAGAVTATLASGTAAWQQKLFVMTDASNSSTLSVTNHVTSDPEVFTFDAVDEALLLQWTGTEWMTIHAQDVTT